MNTQARISRITGLVLGRLPLCRWQYPLPATFSAFVNNTANCLWFPRYLKGIPEKIFFGFGRDSVKMRERLLESAGMLLGAFPEVDSS